MDEVCRIVREIDDGAVVRPFGSYALGARIAGQSDIDVLVLTTVPRDEFFLHFEQAYTAKLNDLVVVRDAFVPVIKFLIGDEHIDMVVAQVYDHCDGEIICWREVDVRSASGYFVTQMIQSITRPFEEKFRASLVRVKTWAVENLVYSNTLGLLNGVGLAVITAWILLQTSTELSPDEVLQDFFEVMLTFDFDRYGINILHDRFAPAAPGKPITVYVPLGGPPPQWINAFHNVGPAQLACIRAAVKRHPNTTNPSESFVQTHTHFLHVHMFSEKDSHAAFVAEFEAKLKLLLKAFDYAHPFPHTFAFESKSVRRSSILIGLKEMPSLQAVSEFVVPFCSGDRQICTDVLSARHLPAFFFTDAG
jgi:poly(A) polymerase Pap1